MGDTLREVQQSVDLLRRAGDESSGWADAQRERFDRQRMQPLLDAGERLIAALRQADDDLTRARRDLGSP